jgi:hypothetical protein
MKVPDLTFSEEVACFVAREYAAARVILEYGSGGSTHLASQLAGKRVFSVESDCKWAQRLDMTIAVHGSANRPVIYYADVGHVKDWGVPADETEWRKFPGYAIDIWTEDFFEQPDVVLVDGRFRVACFLAIAAFTRQNVRVLFDDYNERPHYSVVEKYARLETKVGRMAVFTVPPGAISAADLATNVSCFFDPR